MPREVICVYLKRAKNHQRVTKDQQGAGQTMRLPRHKEMRNGEHLQGSTIFRSLGVVYSTIHAAKLMLVR